MAAITRANCRYICPVMPGMKAAGKNTTARTSVMPMIGPINSRMASIAACFGGLPAFEVLRHALHHDDGIVDDDADAQNQSEQRQQIDAEPERRHRGEGPDDGDRHRRGRHQSGSPVLQEYQYHDQHQRSGLEERAIHLA